MPGKAGRAGSVGDETFDKEQMIDNCSFELGPRGIHVWSLNIDASEALAAQFEPVLAPDEKDRAARFRFGRLRHAFVITRGALRHLLGRYLNLPPASLHFHYGSKGKPALASRAGLEFNATHSGALAAFAFTAGCEIGIDLERVRPVPEAQYIADRLFCSEEAAELRSLAPCERERAFFCCWTRKEAYVKAVADGLSARLDSFRVTLRPDGPARLVYLENDIEDAKAWTLHDLRLAPDYAAALAYRDSRRSLSIYPVIHPTELVSVSSGFYSNVHYQATRDAGALERKVVDPLVASGHILERGRLGRRNIF